MSSEASRRSTNWKYAQIPSADCKPTWREEFVKALDAAYCDLFITAKERDAAIQKAIDELCICGEEKTYVCKHGQCKNCGKCMECFEADRKWEGR